MASERAARRRIVQNSSRSAINSNNPTVRLVNGQLRPILELHAGETQLWRLANQGADIFYRLHLDGYRFTVVGEDGAPVGHVTSAATLLLPPGKPFHVHTGHFQVMSIDGSPQSYRGDQNTVPVPFERRDTPGRVVLRIRLADFTGKWMFHCHIAAHEDNGMMSYLNVVSAR